MAGIARLTGSVKYYDWGGFEHIPLLIGSPNKEKKPYAEYWLGVHPLADCTIDLDGRSLSFRDFIASNGENSLGKKVFHRFGGLPYLLKTLDVRQMLSIQVHPSKAAAEEGYERENQEGIALDSPKRNYKDKNHKPELIVALSDFWLLHGFKTPDKISSILNRKKELNSLLTVFAGGSYDLLYRKVMEMPQGEVNSILKPLLERIIPLYKDNKLEKRDEDFWAARAALTYVSDDNIDRGIFSIYLFNLLKIQKGEGVFQDAGIPHAYLEGQNVEIMANSDNVLRAGLTSKHVDVKELLRHTRCEATDFQILPAGQVNNKNVYRTNAPDFELIAFSMDEGMDFTFTSITGEILLLTKGSVKVSCGDDHLELLPGNPAIFAFPGKVINIHSYEYSDVFRATIPDPL